MPDEPLIRLDWIVDNLGEIGRRLGEHIVMTVIAVIIGFVISFALALLVRRYHSLAGPVLAASGVLYTVPSLALFALVSYTVLILVRNVLTGLDSVPPDVSEAAVGMGVTVSQRLWRIELPIALPVIVAGLRIATVTTIGLVTVTSLIGQGGLGYLIVTIGINQFFSTPIYVGAILSVALAIGADVALLRIQQVLTPWARSRAG